MSATTFPHPPHLPRSLRRGLSLAAALAGTAIALAGGHAAAQSVPPQPIPWSAPGAALVSTLDYVDPADVGIRLATAEGGGSVERWRRDRRRAEAAFWAALPEEPPVVGPPADREDRLP